MKLVTLMLAGSLALGSAACGKNEASTPNVQVESAAASATPSPAEPGAKAPEAVATAATAEAETGCGHAALAAGEGDCPFAQEAMAEHAGGAEEGCHGMGGVEPTAAGDAKHLGQAFTLTESKPLAAVLSAASPDAEPMVRVAGTIEKVCQKRGCWMVVKDGDLEARVIMKDHAFAIPFDAKGQKATVEGTLKVKVFTEAQAKHLAEDGNEDPAKVNGETKEFLLTATGVQLGG